MKPLKSLLLIPLFLSAGVLAEQNQSASTAASGKAKSIANALESNENRSINQERFSAVSKRIANLLYRLHYNKFEWGKDFSAEAFDKLIDILDKNNEYFTQPHIQNLETYRTQLADLLLSGNVEKLDGLVTPLYDLKLGRIEYALQQIDKLTPSENKSTFLIKRAENTQVLNQYWQQKLSHQLNNLLLSGLDEKRAKSKLKQSYLKAKTNWFEHLAEYKFEAFANAVVKTIDEDSVYLPPYEIGRYQRIDDTTPIGVSLTVVSDKVIVESIDHFSAAKAAGLKVGDQILAVTDDNNEIRFDVIDKKLTENLDSEVRGNKLNFSVLEKNGGKTALRQITFERLQWSDRTIVSELLADKSQALIKIESFYNGLSKDLARQLANLSQLSVKKLIIDLRGNGGGSLNEAISVSELFVGKKPVVLIHDQAGKVKSHSGTKNAVFDGTLVLLVDEKSAAATEIFAASVQDHGVGVVLGRETYGRGTVQQHRSISRIYDLFEKPIGSVQYTIAHFFRINGKAFQPVGVIPDVEVDWQSPAIAFEPRPVPKITQVTPVDYRPVRNVKPWLAKVKPPQSGDWAEIVRFITELHKER